MVENYIYFNTLVSHTFVTPPHPNTYHIMKYMCVMLPFYNKKSKQMDINKNNKDNKNYKNNETISEIMNSNEVDHHYTTFSNDGLHLIMLNKERTHFVKYKRTKVGESFDEVWKIPFEIGDSYIITRMSSDSKKFLIEKQPGFSKEDPEKYEKLFKERHVITEDGSGAKITILPLIYDFLRNEPGYGLESYVNLDYLEMINKGNIDINKFIPNMYKYDLMTNNYVYNGQWAKDSPEFYPYELGTLFNDHKHDESNRSINSGIVKIKDTHYYINTLFLTKTTNGQCFIMKDLTNYGPIKIFSPFMNNKNKNIYKGDRIRICTLKEVRNDICYFEIVWDEDAYNRGNVYAIDMVSMYNCKMYSFTTDMGAYNIDFPYNAVKDLGTLSKGKYSNNSNWIVNESETLTKAYVVKISKVDKIDNSRSIEVVLPGELYISHIHNVFEGDGFVELITELRGVYTVYNIPVLENDINVPKYAEYTDNSKIFKDLDKVSDVNLWGVTFSKNGLQYTVYSEDHKCIICCTRNKVGESFNNVYKVPVDTSVYYHCYPDGEKCMVWNRPHRNLTHKKLYDKEGRNMGEEWSYHREDEPEPVQKFVIYKGDKIMLPYLTPDDERLWPRYADYAQFNLDYIERRNLADWEKRKFIPDIYRYDDASRNYKFYNIAKEVVEGYPLELIRKFKESNSPCPKDCYSGIILVKGVHWYLSNLMVGGSGGACFIIKDLTHDGPVKIFSPFDDGSDDIVKPSFHTNFTIVHVEDELCYFVMDNLYSMDIASVYNSKMYSVTNFNEETGVKFPSRSVSYLGPVLKGKYSNDYKYIASGFPDPDGSLVVKIRKSTSTDTNPIKVKITGSRNQQLDSIFTGDGFVEILTRENGCKFGKSYLVSLSGLD